MENAPMEWVLLGLAGCGVAAWGGKRLRDRLRARRDRAVVLKTMVKLCEEDVTLLGEQLRRLDADTAEHPLDEAGRIEYQAALDGYESAQREAGTITDLDQVATVTATLNDGRYALACVQARVAGEPVPEKRTPCFFNPQHGPSVKDVMFTARAGGTKRVPACAQDAARVEAGEKPAIRKIEVNGRKIDYYEARSIAIGKSYGDPAAMNALLSSSGFTGIGGDFGDSGGGV
jgi:hypothetical protein